MIDILREIKRKYNSRKYFFLNSRFPQYNIGRGSYGRNLKIQNWGEGAVLRIGAFCSFAENVQIFLGAEHRMDWTTTYPFNDFWKSAKHIEGHPKTKGDVVIGNDVWVGTDAVILSGVTIGDGAAIGARAVITKDVPAYAVAAGNPARILKKRFDDGIIERLLKLGWWNWDDSVLDRYLPMMLSNDIEGFLNAAENDPSVSNPPAHPSHGHAADGFFRF